MAFQIHEDCINCDLCEPECPNEAISMGEEIYEINTDLCTECIGYYEEAQCVACCPIDCIEQDPNHLETEETVNAKLTKILKRM